MPKSKQQKRLEALGRREADLRFAVRQLAATNPYGFYAQFARDKYQKSAADVRNLRRKLGIVDAPDEQ